MATELEAGPDVTITVEDDGEGPQPWGEGATAFRYRVTVTTPAGAYTSPAWGSQHEYELGSPGLGHPSIGGMVADELVSAANDPDEFFRMAVEGDGGRQRALQVLSTIEAAERLVSFLTAGVTAERIRALAEGQCAAVLYGDDGEPEALCSQDWGTIHEHAADVARAVDEGLAEALA